MKATILQSTLLLSLASVAFSSPLSYDNGYGHTTKVSSDQSCGGANGYTCAGSQWGNCCSTRGHCGNTADYCKAGCQSKYGKCGDSEIVKPKPSYEQTPGYGKPSGPPVSKNGHCGKMNGHTCIGSVFGQCCSQRGNCGSGPEFCGYNCQTGYGKCGEVKKSSSTTLKTICTSSKSSTKVYVTETPYAEKGVYGYGKPSSSVKAYSSAKPYAAESPYGAPGYGQKSSSLVEHYPSETPYGVPGYGQKPSSSAKPYIAKTPYGAPGYGQKSSSAVKPYASETPYGAPGYGEKPSSPAKPYSPAESAYGAKGYTSASKPCTTESAHGYAKSSTPAAKPYGGKPSEVESYGGKGYTPAAKPYASETPYGAPGYGQKPSSAAKPYSQAESAYGAKGYNTPAAKPYGGESAHGYEQSTSAVKPYASKPAYVESAHGYEKSTTAAKPYATQSPYGSKTPFEKPVVPVCNEEVNKNDVNCLVPSYSAVLNYKEAGEGDYAVSLKYKMKYPQVTLENSNYVSDLVCSGESMALTFKNKDAFAQALKWPQNKLMLITNKAGCNPTNDRGAYLLVDHVCDEKTLTMKGKVQPKQWKDIAEWMQPSYGHIASGKSYATAYSTAPVSTFQCSSTLVKATSTPAAGYQHYSTPHATSTPVKYTNVQEHGYGAPKATSTPVKASSTHGGYGSPVSTPKPAPPPAHPGNCPSGYSAGHNVRGGVTYEMTCGKSIAYTGVSIATGGPKSGIHNMNDCMDWCNRYGGHCKVALWDSAQEYSCRLLSSGGGATSNCGTASYATRP